MKSNPFLPISAILLALSAWGLPARASGTAPAPAAVEGTESESSLRFRVAADPDTLDWNLAHTTYETYIIMNLMEGLVEEGPDLRPRPALAEKWDVSADGRTYTFHLRSGVKWSDGRALRASDFVDSWIRLLDPKTGAKSAYFLFPVEGAEDFNSGKLKQSSAVGVKALDEKTLQVQLVKPTPYFLHIPTFWVTFPIRLDRIKKYGADWTAPGKIVTLGPYLLDDWKRGQRIRLKRNPDYAGADKPTVDRVEAVIEPDENRARKLFQLSALDILLNATSQDVAKAKASPGPDQPRVESFPYLATVFLGFNHATPALASAGVRRAIALAVNRDTLPSLLKGGQTVANSLVPPGIDSYDYSAVHLAGDPADGRAALTKAGFGPRNRFPKLSLYLDHFDGAEELAAFLRNSLHEQLGIEITPHVEAPGPYYASLSGGKADLFIGQWGADYPDPADFFDMFRSASGVNYTGWKNAEYDGYVERAAVSMNQKERTDDYEAAEKLLIDKEVVIYPLFYKRNNALVSRRIRELVISPLNYLFLKDVRLSEE